MQFIAHTNDTGKEQSLSEHLNNVAKRTAEYAAVFQSADIGYLIGLLHDIGKYSEAFQRRIRGSEERTDHSSAGAQWLDQSKANKLLSSIAGYIILGHHSGLPDFGSDGDSAEEPTLKGRLKKKIDDFSSFRKEITPEYNLNISSLNRLCKSANAYDFSFQFFVRMLYSCLVDADFLDTEEFVTGGTRARCNEDFETMRKALYHITDSFRDKQGLINEKRREILLRCEEFGKKDKGLYSLTVPTGGGKTLSSMAFALEQIHAHKMKRIIYVIPYSSIIEQTAAVFKNIFGEDKVLEHQYNYEYEYDENMRLSDKQKMLKLASENWDMPIVVTTNVQFFESLFANKSSRCRKLHNLADSVIVFDEVQMFPYHFLLPCLYAVRELVKNYGVTALFCSATQPDFSRYLKEIEIKEITEDPAGLNTLFKRVRINKLGILTDAVLLDEIKRHTRVLVIVNSRKKAYKLYQLLKDDDTYYLSTLLTPEDRKKSIQEIKRKLREGGACRVISTQLIEAGVDIDFPVVFREAAGVDSVIQSAGRCNREGKLALGEVNVYEPEEKISFRNAHLFRSVQIGGMIMKEYDDIISPEAVKRYFDVAYEASNLDVSDMIGCFVKRKGELLLQYDFRQAAERFRLIDSDQMSIVISSEDNKEVIKRLKYARFPSGLLRKLQQSTVSVYRYEFDKLKKDIKLEEIQEGIYVLSDTGLYDRSTGLNIFYDNTNDILIQ